MEKFQSHTIHIPIYPLLLFLVNFSTLLYLISSDYVVPKNYFINCGSNENVDEVTRNFIGDENSNLFSIPKPSKTVKATNQLGNTSNLYHTARTITEQSSYGFKFNNNVNTTYLVRLHFFAFSSQPDLSTAVFDVSASGYLLLHNFTAKNSTNLTLIKEFLLTTQTEMLRIYFTPKESSFAFVNAIEVFPAPPLNFSPNQTDKVGDHYKIPSSISLQKVYRINVGGPEIEPGSDTIWRNWDSDDVYLRTKNTAKNSQFYSNKPYYQLADSAYAAPDLVYQTSKEMNPNANNESKITWSFDVNKTAAHLVRVHFCDIISLSLNTLIFNLYINGNFSTEINSLAYVTQSAAPFTIDFLVHSFDSGVMSIGIGPSNASIEKNAFLNGLEILQIMDGTALVPKEDEPSKISIPIVVGSALGGLALVSVLMVGFFLYCKRRKPKTVEHSSWGHVPAYGVGSSHSRVTELTINGSPIPNLILGLKISFAELQLATKNFNSKLVIGKGGFGHVYKGTLLNGTKVAVKRSAPGSGQGFSEFQTEIMVLSKIRHRHLVSLIGYCDESSEMILVYEYMEKGTLRDHLHDPKLPRLTWKQRLEICIGAASGLNYLHKGSSGGIIHRDVKSTNILLDENHVAKVADFGLSKLSPLEDTHVSTNVKGTLGYLDPEYFRSQQLTEKSDVYSFGVVLLEVLSARPAIDTQLPREQMNLADWAMRCKKKGMIEEIVDPSMKGIINPNSLRKFSETAEKCLQEDGSSRPAMSDVIWDLEYALQLQQTSGPKELNEDSTTTVSSAFVLPNAQRLPSIGSNYERDDTIAMSADFSCLTDSQVFSQLKIDDAR
ncbi:probable receptor-like protein kinase At2g23200 [Cannabis sativa]|uniref:probable receptor-like protein kinase At2g23200 n=1 Tax=Cannabis sativa TaxID=3483 RepID=UPI0029CA6AAF|nr:probable receptor-like protein kinase At2g23200 [Cannabis sativa]